MVAEGGEGIQFQNAGGGGVGGVSRLRFPPGPHLRSSRFSRHPRLRQAPTRRFGWFLWGKGPRPLVGARAPSPLETWPTGPWGLDPATLTDFLQAKFLTSCCVATITPNPLTLGGVGWFPKAELYSSMRGGVPVFAPAFQPLHRAPSRWGPGQQAPEPCIPVKNSKNAPVLIGS